MIALLRKHDDASERDDAFVNRVVMFVSDLDFSFGHDSCKG